MVEAKPEFGYWEVRGLGSVPRLIFIAAGVDFVGKLYRIADQDEWRVQTKPILGSNLPNLPYLKFDGIVISENDTICRVIAAKWKPELLGKDIKEQALVDNYLSAVSKLNPRFRKLPFKNPIASDEERAKCIEDMDDVLAGVNKQLEGRKWIASENVSIADIYFFEIHQALKVTWEPALEKYGNFKKFDEEFTKQAWFSAYKASGKFLEKPMYPEGMATINNV